MKKIDNSITTITTHTTTPTDTTTTTTTTDTTTTTVGTAEQNGEPLNTTKVDSSDSPSINDKDNLKLPRRRPIYETDDLIRELSPPIEGTEDPSTIIGADGTINGRKPVQCNICKRYMPESRLANHIRHLHDNRPSVNPKKNFKCDHCGKQFTIRYTYQQHVKTHTQGRPKCPECGTTFASAFSLFRHRAKNHGIEHNYKTHNCDQCNKTFFSLSELKLHQQRHSTDKEFKCQECNKAFSVKGNLRIHMRTHAKEKLFKCDICGNSFSHPYSLVSHRRIHTNDCPHKCPHCDKDLRPFKCDQCPKTFRSRTAFKMHQDEHKGIKRFTCKFCERQFQCYGNKLKHERRHIGEKKHKCGYCDKAFIEKQELKNHLKIHERNQKSVNSSDIVETEQPSSSTRNCGTTNAKTSKNTPKSNAGQANRVVVTKVNQQTTKCNIPELTNDTLGILSDNVNRQTSGTNTFFVGMADGQQFNGNHHNQTNSTTNATPDQMHGVMIMNTNEASQRQEGQGGLSSNIHHPPNISNTSNVLMQAYPSTVDVQATSSPGIVLSQQLQPQALNQHIDQSGDQYHANSYATTTNQQNQQWHQNEVQQTASNAHTTMHCHPTLVPNQMNIRFALNANGHQHSGMNHEDPYGQQQQQLQQQPQQQQRPQQQLQHRPTTAPPQQQNIHRPLYVVLLQQPHLKTTRSNQQTVNSLSTQQQNIQQQQQQQHPQPVNLRNPTNGNQKGSSGTSVINAGQQQVIQATNVKGSRQFHRNQHVACRLCKQLVPDIRHHLIIFHRVELGSGEDISSWFTPATR